MNEELDLNSFKLSLTSNALGISLAINTT